MKTGFRRLKRMIAYMVIFSMVLAFMPVNASALEVSDISSHWAKDKIQNWIDKGLIMGYENGTFKPDDPITRAEFMSLVNGAFGFSESAEISYSDVDGNAWYSTAVAAAKAAAYVSGYPDNTIKPNNPVTRAEAASMIMRISGLKAGLSGAAIFTDGASLGWSSDAVNAVSAANIMNGYPDGSFRPSELMKRAEAVAALDKALASYNITYSKPGTYGPDSGVSEIAGNVTVSDKGIILQNMVIHRDLTIGKNVGDGNVTLKNVTVKGETKIYGGGQNSILIIDSTLGSVTVSKEDGKIRIVVSGNTTVNLVQALSGMKLEESSLTNEGEGFREIVLNASEDDTIILIGSLDKVSVESENLEIQVPKGSTINTLTINKKAKITGAGMINTAYVNAGGVTLETAPGKLVVASGVSEPIIGAGGSGGGGGGGGGSGDGGTKKIAVSEVSISGDPFVGQTLTANPKPAGASVDFQWMRSASEDGTYDKITDATNRTYTLTEDDTDMYIKAAVTGTGIYTGTRESSAVRVAAFREIISYTPLPVIELNSDENLVNLTELMGADILPDEVTVTDGSATAAAVISDWEGLFDGTIAGTYDLDAEWTMPPGYVDDVSPVAITATVNVVQAQTVAVLFEAPVSRGDYYAEQGYDIPTLNEMMRAMWATEGAIQFPARTADGVPIQGAYIEIRPIFSVNSDGSVLTINADNITQSVLDWLEHDFNTGGRIAIGMRLSGSQVAGSINNGEGTPLIGLDTASEDWEATTVRVNLHDLVSEENSGTIRTIGGYEASFQVIVTGDLTPVSSVTVSSPSPEITTNHGELPMSAVFELPDAYDQTLWWSVITGPGVAAISNTGHGTTGRLYAQKDGTVQVYTTAVGTGIQSNLITITISGQTGPDAPTGIGATNETAADLNDGTLTGVAPGQEYKLVEAEDDAWTPITGDTVVNLSPGSYTVRVAETATDPAGTQTAYDIIINAAPATP